MGVRRDGDVDEGGGNKDPDRYGQGMIAILHRMDVDLLSGGQLVARHWHGGMVVA